MKTQKQARNQAIARAKKSLSKLSIISRNVNMINQKQSTLLTPTSELDDNTSVSCMTFDQRNHKPTTNIDTFNQKYSLGKKLGEGSSGLVRQCLHIRKNKIYACKSIMFDDQHVPLMEKNFSDVRRLDHQNIVKYKALYLDLQKHLAYLVMQYIEFPSLMKYISELPQPTSENDIKWIFEQLFRTLQHMHNKGISHRDIKPENIMIDKDAKKIKIIDFGIAKRMTARRQKVDMLTITGTLFYRAPQMFLGGGYNEKVDIWAAGITLYQALYGKTPFQSEYHSETIYNIQNVDIQVQADQKQQIPEILHDLIVRLLRKDPKQRFSARDALSHLWFNSKKIFKLKQRYSDVGHVIETQFSKFQRQQVEVDYSWLNGCKNGYEIKKTYSPTYYRMQVEDF